MKPVLLVIAGPNGAGKTTVTTRLRAEKWSDGVEYINPDDVAQNMFGDWNSPTATRAALEWTEKRREELLASREGIAFETVFSAPDKIDFLIRARSSGYFIRVFFVGTSDPSINAKRVALRYMKGGHDVPISKIISRYGKSIANLAVAIQLADRAYVYDNSLEGVEARLCVRTEEGRLRKVYGPLPAWVADSVDSLARDDAFVDLRTT